MSSFNPTGEEAPVLWHDVRVAESHIRRIEELRDEGRVDEAARAGIRAWDETETLAFSGHVRALLLRDHLWWAVGEVPWVRAELEARARTLQDELARRHPTVSDTIALAVLALLLDDTEAREAALRLACTLDPEAFARQMVDGAMVSAHMWQLGLGEIVGRFLAAPPTLFDEIERLESGFRISTERSNDLIREMIERRGLPSQLAQTPNDRYERMAWGFSTIVARCLHAAGRNADALAVLRRAGERGKEAEARALIEELGLE